jgi:hypothetical protein
MALKPARLKRVIPSDSSNSPQLDISSHQELRPMKKYILAALALTALSTNTMANDLSEKAMRDLPGVTGQGVTSNPTSKPATDGLADKAARDLIGFGGGATANPTSKPADGSLADKAMRDALRG